MKNEKFNLISKYKPSGDQPKAIYEINNLLKKQDKIVLLGATGTGKTFTMANVINEYNKPTLVLAPNKTLANQLYKELKSFFPNNRVEYFISNFDFYQPEAYKPNTDTYIEKSSQQNWEIEMMRLSTKNALIKRNDVIVVGSVACIYGQRSPREYEELFFEIVVGEIFNRKLLIGNLVKRGYSRSDDTYPGNFSVKGDVIIIVPAWTNQFLLRIEIFGDEIEKIFEINSITMVEKRQLNKITIFPANSYSVMDNTIPEIISFIKKDLNDRVKYFESKNMLVEKQRLQDRVKLDIEQIEEYGYTSGMENYSIYLSKERKKGDTPFTLIDYFPLDFLTIIDESHLFIPQVKGMYEGDKSRKTTLSDFGFRLPSSLENRPLKLEEFEKKIKKVIYVSATPANYEMSYVNNKYVEQIIRPTGLLDPIIEIKPEEYQLDDLIEQIKDRKIKNERVFINTITKKLSEDISNYLSQKDLSIAYIHSELKTLEREEVLRKLRIGFYDAVVGINLLREGLDIPEVSLIAILEANKEGFLRNTRSLIQIIGRAARNINGKVIMYANNISNAMQQSIDETNRRRKIQEKYNIDNNIEPKTISKPIPSPILENFEQKHKIKFNSISRSQQIKSLEDEMKIAISNYDFEKAIQLRDLIMELKN